MDSPDASCRWIWLSVVRAPMAPQETRSAMYCGLMGSRNSVPAGRPSAVTCCRKRRAERSPAAMSWLPSSRGSLIRPFQPTVVRGFSKYARITISRSSLCFSAWLTSRRAYSRPALGSWMEQGPTMTSKRSSTPSMTARTSSRPRATTSASRVSSGSSATMSCGVGSGVNSLTRRLEVDSWDSGAASMLMFGGPVPGCGAGPDQNPPGNGEGQRMISALLALKEGWMRVS